MGQIGAPLVGSYDLRLVALSILVAISASYAALDLGGRVTAARGWIRSGWLAGGAAAMGFGIWSMHFTGMLAFHLPARVAYHWPTVLLSLLSAIFASAVALYVVSRKKMGRVGALTGSVVMGLGIAGMHYIGMAAMRLPAVCHYSSLLVTFSLLIAIIASMVALVFTFGYREDFRGTTLAKVIGATLTSAADRRFAMQAQELQSSERFRQIAAILRDVLALSTGDLSEVLFVNRAYEAIWGRTTDSLYADPRSWLEGVHPDDRQQVQEAVRRLVRGEPLDYLECRVVRPDASISWVRLRAYPVVDAQGRPHRIVVTAHEFTKRKQAEQAVRQLSGQLLRLQDDERRRIARDLHDSTGQDLAALALMLDQLRGSIPSGERKSRRLLSECTALADRCVREVRTLSYVLHPPLLDEAGLEDTIRDYVNGFTKRSGIQVGLELPPGLGKMTREVELTLFRVVQEALTNIQRHSGSQQAKIRIDRNSHLTLEISDLGQGISASAPQGKEEPPFQVGVGIPSMQERVKLIGGRLDIDSTSHGTTVRVTIPLERNEREKAAHSGG